MSVESASAFRFSGLRRAAIGFADGLRGVGELARGRDHGDGAGQPLGGVGIGERAEHLEGQLRQAVAIGRERQLLEDHIGGAAIGGRAGRTHLRGDERVRRLRLVAGIPAPGDAGEVHRIAICPDAADAGDRAFAQGDGEARVVEILGRLDLAAPAALAAPLRGGLRLLAEIGRPDDVAAHPHAAIEPRDDRAFGGRGDAQRVEPRALDALRGRQRRDDPAVDDRADGGANETADGRGADAEDRAADAAANGGAGRAENESGHVGILYRWGIKDQRELARMSVGLMSCVVQAQVMTTDRGCVSYVVENGLRRNLRVPRSTDMRLLPPRRSRHAGRY